MTAAKYADMPLEELLRPHRCPATSTVARRDGRAYTQCRQIVPPGLITCRWHGSASPQSLAAQAGRLFAAGLPIGRRR